MNKCPFIATKECEIPPCDSCVNFINCSFRDICSFDMHSGKELKKDEKHGKMRPKRRVKTMGYKSGLIQKLKLCYFWLITPTRKNMLTSTCEYCGSSNLVAIKQTHRTDGNYKNYTYKLLCMNCKAECAGTQRWHRHSEREREQQ